MQKLDSKKIGTALTQLTNAAKGAVRAINEMTDNSLKESPLEKDSLVHIGHLVGILLRAKDQVALEAQYEGMDDDQIALAQAAEREAEKETLQQQVQERLAKRQPKEDPIEAIVEENPAGDGDPNQDQQS